MILPDGCGRLCARCDASTKKLVVKCKKHFNKKGVHNCLLSLVSGVICSSGKTEVENVKLVRIPSVKEGW